MSKFNIICPDHYPMKCNLSPADRDYLLTPEKYKAFFIFQYKVQDSWLEPTLQRYFSERTWRLFNAGKEGGTGTKFCNICRYALAADFGIASLTPLNYNVFQEIGLMQGLQKPVLYILNPGRKSEGKLPFDMDDQIYIEHTDSNALEQGLSVKLPLLLNKLQLITGYSTELRRSLESKLRNLSPSAVDLLKRILLEGEFRFRREDLARWVMDASASDETATFEHKHLQELQKQRFIISELESGGTKTLQFDKFNEPYRKHLEQLLFG
ncbi:MAG: hypothetical protein ACLQVJ_13755 [Syntrophobacteraceae bacterium]